VEYKIEIYTTNREKGKKMIAINIFNHRKLVCETQRRAHFINNYIEFGVEISTNFL
jgi:hypothetical protein